MENLKVFSIFLFVRILSVFVIQTWYVPDEYWQSLEVAHKFVFGYGELTWEWKHGVRSYIYPLIISVAYKILQLLSLDSVTALLVVPRVMQAVLTAYSDYRFYHWSGLKKWSIFTVCSSFFWFYVGSRTLINTFETALTTIALSYFPWPNKPQDKNNNTFIWIVGFLCVVRPTAVIQWLPLCFYHMATSQETAFRLIITRYAPIGLSLLIISFLIDSWAYGSLVVSSYEFVKANLIYNVGLFYGSHPWYWYLSTGLPAILGVNFVPFVLAAYHVIRYRKTSPNELVLLGTMVFTIAVYSLLPHKEFRFILPLLPFALHIQAVYLSRWSIKSDMVFVWVVAGILTIGNVIPTYILGTVHQRGALDVMEPLQKIAHDHPHNSSFLFLTPCHSTPMYSHIHANVTIRYLTCLPNLSNLAGYLDDADAFYSNPRGWLRDNYPPNRPFPSHIIAFDVLEQYIFEMLRSYRPIHTIFHAKEIIDKRVGKNLIIYERIDTKPPQSTETPS